MVTRGQVRVMRLSTVANATSIYGTKAGVGSLVHEFNFEQCELYITPVSDAH